MRGWWLSGVLVLAGPALAQAPGVVGEGEGGRTTVVTGSRSVEHVQDAPVAVEVITRRDIEASGARDVAELLSGRPGVEVMTGFAGAGLRLRGLGPEYSLLLVDGERVAGRVDGQLDLSRLSTDNIEQIEIVKGPSSVLYGSDAMAGVVNIVTRKARRPLGADARVSYGGLRQLELEGGGEARGERWGLRLGGGFRRRDAYALDPSRQSTSGSDLDSYRYAGRGEWKASERWRLEAKAEGNRKVQRGVDALTTGAVIDRASQDEALLATLLPTWELSEHTTLSFTAHYSRFRHRFVYDQRGGAALDRIDETLEQLAKVGAQLNQDLGASHQLVAGAEGLTEVLASNRLSGGRGRRSRLSLFAQDAWRVVPGLVAVPGLRVDVDSQFGTVATPRLAVRVDPLSALTVRASYGFAFRSPSFQELLIDFENPSVGYVVAGNPALRPETSRGADVSAEARPVDGTLVWLSLFQNDLRDMITVVTLPETTAGLRFGYDNIARARVRGVEVGWNQRLPASLLVELGYTFTQARDLTEDRALPGQAAHRLTARASWRYRPWGLEASVRGGVVGARPYFEDAEGDGVEETVRAPRYVTVDAQLSKSLGEAVKLFVAGNNLAGAGDARFLPIPPRALYAGVSARF
ncbi:TonB-dependent receptor plug domain-containing protein [Archangium primigenium]|uniref:TonB-dependent receptor plug domain-containing protein n=1 Tax=[Archangium] primigenium TaxID=2792470 RepID=UPI00195B3B73|nr:TonB-dependent receptor [Archangium primigenium]MBM7116374.1 TonB-dependent receptor [Archangium primigenium]